MDKRELTEALHAFLREHGARIGTRTAILEAREALVEAERCVGHPSMHEPWRSHLIPTTTAIAELPGTTRNKRAKRRNR